MPQDHAANPLLIVISGPSGAGKDTVLHHLKQRGLPFHFVVTATTRHPRPNEQHGVDYFFVSEADFKGMIDAGELIEYALVYGQYKGIPKQQVRDAFATGRDVVMRIDVQGAAAIREKYPQAVLIYLTAENDDELARRLAERRSEKPVDISTRLAAAHQEAKKLPIFDYLVINPAGDVEAAVDQIAAVITTEHLRVQPRRLAI